MKRREFITPLGGAAGAWPVLSAHSLPIIGFLGGATPSVFPGSQAPFRSECSICPPAAK